jgi:hypothetical protein
MKVKSNLNQRKQNNFGMKPKNLKFLLLTLGVILSLFLAAMATDLFQSQQSIDPPPKSVITEGSMVEPCSYLIFIGEGSPKTYFAKNCSTGEIVFSDTDAKTVIQNSINSIKNGKIFIKAGNYTTPSPPQAINIPREKTIEIAGEGMNNTILYQIGINIHGGGYVHDLTIDMSGTSYSCISTLYNDRKVIENVYLKNWGHAGIRLSHVNNSRYSTSNVWIRNNLFRNDRPAYDTTSGGILLEGYTGEVYIIGNRFERHNVPFIEAYGEKIDDVWLIGNEFVGPQIFSDPMYPMTGYNLQDGLGDGGALYVIGNIWKPAEESGLDSYRNPGISLQGRYILFANNIMIGSEVNRTPSTTATKPTYMSVLIKNAQSVHIVGNYFYNLDGAIKTTRSPNNINNIVIKDNNFIRSNIADIMLGNSDVNNNLTINNVVIEGNHFVDWDWSNLYLYQSIHTSGRSSTYPAIIKSLIIRYNTFVKETTGYNNVGHTVFGNDAYPPSNIQINNLIYEGNVFINVTKPLGNLGSITTPILKKIENNVGYTTEKSGNVTLPASQSSITVAHNLISTPTKIIVTPEGNVGNWWVSAKNSTHFTVSVSTAPTSDVVLNWYAEV